MDLRPELLPPAVDQSRLDELAHEIERISNLISSGDSADGSIASFNEQTGHTYAVLDFAEYHGWRSLREFAREAARPAPPRVLDITREELIEIVSRILTADTETDYYVMLFEVNVPHPRATDLIFHPLVAQNPSAESIVDAALSYRAIEL
ncbi:bacteriocin immunity protein [Nocardia sp. NPDC052001]|uniref:bacteriocin immunity protein n=1 Tax=Nocardia sp. NPDC052001 TaxID=3154853 RepID=UPI003440CDEE